MAGIDSIGSIGGGGGDIEEFKKLQNTRISEAQTQATEVKQGGGDAGAAQSIGQAQGAPSNQQYPQL